MRPANGSTSLFFFSWSQVWTHTRGAFWNYSSVSARQWCHPVPLRQLLLKSGGRAEEEEEKEGEREGGREEESSLPTCSFLAGSIGRSAPELTSWAWRFWHNGVRLRNCDVPSAQVRRRAPAGKHADVRIRKKKKKKKLLKKLTSFFQIWAFSGCKLQVLMAMLASVQSAHCGGSKSSTFNLLALFDSDLCYYTSITWKCENQCKGFHFISLFFFSLETFCFLSLFLF